MVEHTTLDKDVSLFNDIPQRHVPVDDSEDEYERKLDKDGKHYA